MCGSLGAHSCHKYMSHFASMYCYYPLNPQVLFYDGHVRHFDDRELDILCRHNIQSLILKTGDYMHDQTGDNGPNMKIKNLYGNTIINWTRHHGTLKFTLSQMNSGHVITCEAFTLSTTTITQNALKNKNNPPPPPTPLPP